MINDYICIKFFGNDSISLRNLKVQLMSQCNKIVCDGITDCFGKIKIPICGDNGVYNLIIYSNLSMIRIPLIAKKDKIYCIDISSNKVKKQFVTIMLIDKYNPSIKIEGGKMLLWQDTQSK